MAKKKFECPPWEVVLPDGEDCDGVTITVNRRGEFLAYGEDGSCIRSSASLSALREGLARDRRVKAVRVSIPFSKIHSNGAVSHGVAYGIHPTNGSVLVDYGDRIGKKQEKFESYSSDIPTLRLDEQKTEKAKNLRRALDEARAEYDRFTRANRVDLRAIVLDAVNGAIARKQIASKQGEAKE